MGRASRHKSTTTYGIQSPIMPATEKRSCSSFGSGLKLRKRFRYCRRDEFGTRAQRGGHECVRLTPLGREVMLRTGMRMMDALNKIGGVYDWDEYKQNRPAIDAHLASIAAALERYKARRVERGLFHLVPRANSAGFWLLSPLRARPGAERQALDRWKRQRKMRAAAALRIERETAQQAPAAGWVSSLVAEMKTSLVRPGGMLYLGYVVSVCVLSCLIVLL